VNLNEGYQPNKKIKNPMPPGPENQKVSVTIGGCERPPTTEYHGTKHKRDEMEPMSVFSFTGFMFCAFCFGLALGGIL